jgi:hypothetical protein
MLLTLVHGHLRGGCRHSDCTAEKCADGCGFRELDEWLQSPVLRRDELADERQRDRLTALLRGEIPA